MVWYSSERFIHAAMACGTLLTLRLLSTLSSKIRLEHIYTDKHIHTCISHFLQGKLTEEQIAGQILEASRFGGSEDDITVIVATITY